MLEIEFKFNKYEGEIKVENLSRFRSHKPASFSFSQEGLQQIKLPIFPLLVVLNIRPSATILIALPIYFLIVGTTFFLRHLRIV
jgi:hypothetical protein